MNIKRRLRPYARTVDSCPVMLKTKEEKVMITSEEPTVSSTGRYTVTQTCEILGIHRNTLREYTSSGRIKCGFRRESARKFYEGKEIIRFWRAQL